MNAFVPLNAITARVQSKGREVVGYQLRGDPTTIGLSFDGFSKAEQDRLESMVLNHIGLTGTGWYGELRDMIAQLSIIARELEAEVEISEDTQQEIEREERDNPISQTEGLAW